MGALIIAMVLAAAVVHGAETAKRRSVDAWQGMKQRAEERGAARERDRQARAAEFERKLNEAHRRGPAAPLWWAHAAGFVIAGAAAALGAGVAGAAAGAVEGARSGYALGREGGRKGWDFAQSWQEWRKQARRQIELAQCPRCGGWIPAADLAKTERYGWVCGDCVPQPANERDESASQPCHWCGNSTTQALLDEDRWCPNCRNLYQDAEAETDHEDEGATHNRSGDPTTGSKPGCVDCGSPTSGDGWVLCTLCALARHHNRKRQTQDNEARTATQSETPAGEAPHRIYVHAERVHENNPSKEIKNMTALPSAHSAEVISTSEGYATTVADLESLAKLLAAVQEKVTGMNESLTAQSLDVETLNQLSELTDGIETVTSQAQALRRHVVDRHNPLADATAAAGGSQNVAAKTFYDEY